MLNKIGHLESLRALAALMVMSFHFVSYHNGVDFIIYNEGIREYSKFGAQGVELFYMISGFVISYSFIKNEYHIRNYFRYALKRIIRIIPTYFFAIVLALIAKKCFEVYVWELPFKLDWKQILANLTFTSELFGIEWLNEIYVTLKVEFQFYLVIGLLWPLITKNRIVKSVVFAAWLIGAYFTVAHQTFLINGPYFIIGISLCMIYLKKDVLFNYIVVGVCLLFLAWRYELQDLIISVIGIVLISIPKLTSKLTEFLGKSSYTLYLLHGTFGGWFLFWFTKDNFVHLNHKLAILIAIVISVVFSILLHYAIEKPFIKLGKRLKYKQSED